MEKVEIKKILIEEYRKLNNDMEVSYFVNDLAEVLYSINEEYSSKIVDYGLYSKEKAIQRNSIIDKYLKQTIDNIKDNIKLSIICKKAKDVEMIKSEVEKLKDENENLKTKVMKAQVLITDAELEVEKTKKATLNNIKKNMQISRDRIVAIANTTFSLRDQINNRSNTTDIEITLNNIIENVEIITDEFSKAKLWDEDDYKPTITTISLKDIKEQEPLKKRTRKTTKKKTTEDLNTIKTKNIENDDEIVNNNNEKSELIDSVVNNNEITELEENNNITDNLEIINQKIIKENS